MQTIAEFRIPTDRFALHRTLADTDVSFEAERVTAHESDRVIPLLWAAGERSDLDRLEEVLRADPSVEGVTLVTELEDERLFQMEWVKNVRFVVYMLVEEHAAILSASGSSAYWHFRVLFPDREAVSATYDFCEEWDLGISLESVYDMTHERHGRFGLTAEQSEALVLALAKGYFDIPRAVDMDGLADELEISRQAVSERLRRAHKQLVRATMAIGHEADASRKGP